MPKQIQTETGDEGTRLAVTIQEKARVFMQIGVSLVILFVGILILTTPNRLLPTSFDEGTKRIATGWIGAVVGYWLS